MVLLPWWVLCICQASLVISVVSPKSCFRDQKTSDIPANHLSWEKTKPWVFGHKGNPNEYQENTMEGFQSLVRLQADGLETDTFLTNDGQLVLFHDDNATRLTGKDKNIWDMTKEDIKNLGYKENITYGDLTVNYTKLRPVALLEDLLTAMKNNDLLIYIEMKPMSIIHKDIAYTKRSLETGKAVAQLIRNHSLEHRVFLASFDPVKTWAAKQENPNLVIGSFFLNSYWKQNSARNSAWYNDLKCQLKLLPGLKTCLDSLPNDKTMMDVLFTNGSISKSIDDSFLDIHFEIFRDGIFNVSAINVLQGRYNMNISLGSSTIYDMKLNENQTQDTEPLVQKLIENGVERLFTDNVTRLRKKLDRNDVLTTRPTTLTITLTNTSSTNTSNTSTLTNTSSNTTITLARTTTSTVPRTTTSNAASKSVWSVLLFIPLLVTFSFG